jgi:DNA-binding NtrC family response regulator
MVHTVLIIDHEPTQRDLLTYSLKNRLGYNVVAAASAHEGVNYFYADSPLRPDLTLFDVSTTHGGDSEAGLKMLSAYAPLVVLVKYGDYEAAAAALSAGAQDFLTKPVAMERVSTTFRNLLLLRDARRDAERLQREHTNDVLFTQQHGSVVTYSAVPPVPLMGEDGNVRRMEEIEAEAIRFAMQYYHGRMTEVARRLGIGRSTLYRKLSSFSSRQEEAA